MTVDTADFQKELIDNADSGRSYKTLISNNLTN